jgi:hypothetical protein
MTGLIRKEKMLVPALMWIAFWSSLMGIAAGWQETALPFRVGETDRRDRRHP